MARRHSNTASEPGRFCDDCGNRSVRRRTIYGQQIDECDLCGALSGDAALIERIETDREADARGVERGIFPLVRELDEIKGLRCHGSTAGDPERGVPPSVTFRLNATDAMRILDTLVVSLTLANPGLRGNWHIEVVAADASSAGFSLRPRLPVNRDELAMKIELYQQDVGELTKQLRAHKRLQWWRI